MNDILIPPDFVDHLLLPYLTELLNAELESAADIYVFSARYFEDKVKEKEGYSSIAKESHTIKKRTGIDTISSIVPEFSYDSETKFFPKNPYRLEDHLQKNIAEESTAIPKMKKVAASKPKQKSKNRYDQQMSPEQKEPRTFERMKEFSDLLPDYISVMIDLLENFIKETKTSQELGKKVLVNKEKLAKLQDLNKATSSNLIQYKTVSAQTSIDKQANHVSYEAEKPNDFLINPNISQGIIPDKNDRMNLIEKELKGHQFIVHGGKTHLFEDCKLTIKNSLPDSHEDSNIKCKDKVNLTPETTLLLLENVPVNLQNMSPVPESKLGGPQSLVQGRKHDVCETCTCRMKKEDLWQDANNSKMEEDFLRYTLIRGIENPNVKHGDVTKCNLMNVIGDCDSQDNIDSHVTDSKKTDKLTLQKKTADNVKDIEQEFEFEMTSYEENNESETSITISFSEREELKCINDFKPDISENKHEQYQGFPKIVPELLLEAITPNDSDNNEENALKSKIPKNICKNTTEENIPDYETPNGLFKHPMDANIPDCGTSNGPFKHIILENILDNGNGLLKRSMEAKIPDGGTLKGLFKHVTEKNILNSGILTSLFKQPKGENIPDYGFSKSFLQNPIASENLTKEETSMNVPTGKFKTIYKATERLKEQLQHLTTVSNTLQYPCQQFENSAENEKGNGEEASTALANENVIPITGKNWLRTYFTVQKMKGIREDDWKASYAEGQNIDLGDPVWTLHSEQRSPYKFLKKDGFYNGFRSWYFARRLQAIEKQYQ